MPSRGNRVAQVPPSVRVVPRFGPVLTGRLRRGDVPAAWDDDAVASLDVYGFYASRVRALRREKEGPELEVEALPRKRLSPPRWARLISEVYQAAPLVCKAAEVRSRSWRAPPVSCLFGESWAIRARARRSMKSRRPRSRSGRR